MFLRTNKNFSILVFAAVFNIVLAYFFGNSGYEAFITTAIALGLLITWQSLQLVKSILKRRDWLVIKIAAILALGFFWFVITGAVMISTNSNSFDSSITIPSIHWWLVAIGTLPYLLPKVLFQRSSKGFDHTNAGWLTTMYSVMILFVAALGFYRADARLHGILLVVAAQLQYIMNNLVMTTNYLQRSHIAATAFTKKHRLSGRDLGNSIEIAVVGAPFVLPLLIILVVSSL